MFLVLNWENCWEAIVAFYSEIFHSLVSLKNVTKIIVNDNNIYWIVNIHKALCQMLYINS